MQKNGVVKARWCGLQSTGLYAVRNNKIKIYELFFYELISIINSDFGLQPKNPWALTFQLTILA